MQTKENWFFLCVLSGTPDEIGIKKWKYM